MQKHRNSCKPLELARDAVSKLQNARDAVAKLLEGNAPNGISAESCGAHAEAVDILYQSHREGGTELVKQDWKQIREEFPSCVTLSQGAKCTKCKVHLCTRA